MTKERNSTKNISILLWNIEGLRNAIASISTETITKYDAIILTETFLKEDYSLKGYYAIHSFAQPTAGRPAGGVSIFVKPSLGSINRIIKYEKTIIIRTADATIIGLYINPQTATEDAAGKVAEAIMQSTGDKRVILAGDLNCRIDKPNNKTELILDSLVEEGYTLINKPTLKTYIAPNGTSSIDLVFYRGEGTKIINQKGLWTSDMAPIRKHIPIVTTMEIHQSQSTLTSATRHRTSRKLDVENHTSSY